jgi:hypothetical protein
MIDEQIPAPDFADQPQDPTTEAAFPEAAAPEDPVPVVDHPGMEEMDAGERAGEAPATQAVSESTPRPARAPRRSWGRVLRIEADGAAWLADFRPLGREVRVQLRTAFQSNPGHVLEYELKPAGPGRWSGIDVIFNRPPDLGGVLVLDEGRGLSPEGLAFVKRAIVQDPACLGAVFRTAPGVGRQLLEDASFPLPKSLVRDALRVPVLAQAAARRLQGGGLEDPAGWVALVLMAKGRDEESLLRRLLQERPEWLLEHLPLPAGGRRERVLRWWRRTGDPRWLLQLDGSDLPDEAALPLLRLGLLGDPAARGEAEREGWSRLLGPETHARLQRVAFLDETRTAADSAALAASGAGFGALLKELATDEKRGAEARSLLLERGELDPRAALDLLRKGAEGEAARRLLSIVAGAPADSLPDPGAERAREWFQLGVEDPALAGLAAWLGRHAAVQEEVEGWLADPATRPLALEALCQGGEFTRARVQRLLGLAMEPAIRTRLVVAISARQPERWSERYLVNAVEKSDWLAAGAPLA